MITQARENLKDIELIIFTTEKGDI